MLILVITGILLSKTGAGAGARARAQGTNRAGLVVRFGDGSYITRCIPFSESEISGLDVLTRSGLTVVAAGWAICDIEGESGCTAEDCFCQCPGGGGPCIYWSYWHLGNGSWDYSGVGSGGYKVHNGDVEGWSWGSEAPPIVSFDEICPTLPPADVSVSKADSADSVFPGELLTYTLTVSNTGPHEAQGVVVNDVLPPEVALVNTTPPYGTLIPPSGLTWDRGTLASQESEVLTVVVEVHPWVTTTFTNTVQVISISDVTPDNNYAEATTDLRLPYSVYLPIALKRWALQ
jgi:uncharacterized repeat protein (TIGR01451 family)